MGIEPTTRDAQSQTRTTRPGVALDLEILAYARHTKEVQDAMLHEKQIKAKDAYDALRTNVEAVRLTKLPPDKWTSTDLSTIILWYKRPNDSAIPKKNR